MLFSSLKDRWYKVIKDNNKIKYFSDPINKIKLEKIKWDYYRFTWDIQVRPSKSFWNYKAAQNEKNFTGKGKYKCEHPKSLK